jgi:chromate transporter
MNAMPPISTAAMSERESPTVAALFTGFFKLGLMGFGGVLPLARRMVVEDRRWLSGEEFTELLGLCQFLPGGNIINMSVAIGSKFHGALGALSALLGLIVAPTAIVIGLGVVYDRFSSDPRIEHMFAGLAAAAAGLLLSMAIKIVWPLRKRPVAIAIAAICFVAIAIFSLPLVTTMLVLGAFSILVTWLIEARKNGSRKNADLNAAAGKAESREG